LSYKFKISHFYIFGCGVYVFLSSKFCVIPCSELIIFIGYKDNSYCFMYYIQGNIIFHFIYAIFDKKLFFKYTDFYMKEHKLYNKLLDKISSETELSMSSSSKKIDLLQYLFYTYPFLLFKTILLLIFLHPFFLISLWLLYLSQGLKSL